MRRPEQADFTSLALFDIHYPRSFWRPCTHLSYYELMADRACELTKNRVKNLIKTRKSSFEFMRIKNLNCQIVCIVITRNRCKIKVFWNKGAIFHFNIINFHIFKQIMFLIVFSIGFFNFQKIKATTTKSPHYNSNNNYLKTAARHKQCRA